MNLQILNFWRVWENFEGGLDNIVRWYDGTGNMFRDDPENMLSRDFYDFNQVWRIQTQISSAICKKINKNHRPSQYVLDPPVRILAICDKMIRNVLCYFSFSFMYVRRIVVFWRIFVEIYAPEVIFFLLSKHKVQFWILSFNEYSTKNVSLQINTFFLCNYFLSAMSRDYASRDLNLFFHCLFDIVSRLINCKYSRLISE